MALKVGDVAPNFELFSTEKQKVSLSDFKGKNVTLVFFPLAFTWVCTKELCNIRDNITLYNNAQSNVLGISVDSLFTLAKFKEEQSLNFPLLSDFNKKTSSDYGVLYDIFPAFEMQGVSKRAVFVIDGNGIIQHIEVCATPGDLPNFEAVQQVLNTL